MNEWGKYFGGWCRMSVLTFKMIENLTNIGWSFLICIFVHEGDFIANEQSLEQRERETPPLAHITLNRHNYLSLYSLYLPRLECISLFFSCGYSLPAFWIYIPLLPSPQFGFYIFKYNLWLDKYVCAWKSFYPFIFVKIFGLMS